MTDTTLQHPRLAQEAKNVNVALGELFMATGRLASALWATMTQGSETRPAKTARKQADKLRAYADQLYRTDPSYAEDLYAAATRHERNAAKK